MTHLVLVESFSKTKLISQYLNSSKRLNGKKFEVFATLGHVRDLGHKNLSVDIEKGFKPIYEVLTNKKAMIQKLVKKVKTAETVWLASDFDREGESIAMHLKVLLKPKCPCFRVVFTEITPDAIVDAFLNPRDIDYNLVNAQETRRILDRLVGYKISPLLWKEFKGIKGLSAGRVQSSGLSMIDERENEISNFKTSKNNWEVTAEFKTDTDKILSGHLNKTFKTKKDTESFLNTLDFDFKILEHKSDQKNIPSSKPFKTSSLQQTAYNKFGFNANKTMALAQELYEKGLITYMRTESTFLCSSFVENAHSYIKTKYGEEYCKKDIKTIQKGAHEAIRPTSLKLELDSIGGDAKRLFDMIYKRSLESVMSDEVRLVTVYKIACNNYTDPYFICTDSTVKFEGFNILSGSHNEYNRIVTKVDCTKVIARQKWKEPPKHFTEASFIKCLEQEGIGRPSTYASTVAKLMDRSYIIIKDIDGEKVNETSLIRTKNNIDEIQKPVFLGKEKNVIEITDIGKRVNGFVKNKFDYICDRKFTAHMESDLDKIAEGTKKHKAVLDSFWSVFSKNL